MEHGVYHVRGFRVGKTVDDNIELEYHIVGSFQHVKEARKFMTNPFAHKVSEYAWKELNKVCVGLF